MELQLPEAAAKLIPAGYQSFLPGSPAANSFFGGGEGGGGSAPFRWSRNQFSGVV